MSADSAQTIMIGLSGPSSSGKTTLARLLREIFNVKTDNIAITLFIVHEDDFYKTDIDIPWRTWTSPKYGDRKLQDWDCVESLDLPLIKRITTHIKQHGQLPTDFASKEDQNSVGDTRLTQAEITTHRDEFRKWLNMHTQEMQPTAHKKLYICILEGFLLFPPPSSALSPSPTSDTTATTTTETSKFSLTSATQLSELAGILYPNLDLKIFLPSTKELTMSRRAARSGYVTLEGFWEDPPGYVEELVWPNYARDQGWLFDSVEDVDRGIVNVDKARQEAVLVGPGRGNQGIDIVLDWGIEVLKGQIVEALNRN